MAMCHGLHDNNCNPLISFEVEPWKSFPVTQIHPNKDGYAKEVICRWNQGQSGTQSNKLGPNPKQWNLSKIHDWLDQNPITDPTDIEFLKSMVSSWKEVIEAARKENDNDNARLGVGYWNLSACMRLSHALVDHNDIKAKFLNRLNHPVGRSTVEKREQFHATDVWHLLTDRWNDEETCVLPHLHTEFIFDLSVINYIGVIPS